MSQQNVSISIGHLSKLMVLHAKHNSETCFSTLGDIELIASRTKPTTVYLHGAGAFAAVFKAKINDRTYALRCPLVQRTDLFQVSHTICSFLKGIDVDWKVDCDFLANEISIDNHQMPVIKMEWVEGVLLNRFVEAHLFNNEVLGRMQTKFFELSKSLGKFQIAHGDLQCGNIIVTGDASDFSIKLVDYDGMYIPSLRGQKSTENGRSEFQHPKRTLNDFDENIDQFSFWVIITALEALKFDKSLFRETMQGGFNTLDNMLFVGEDFINPSQSPLFKKLYGFNQPSLNFYLDKLKGFCINDYPAIEPLQLFEHKVISEIKVNGDLLDEESTFKINCAQSVVVLSSTFKKLGNTPIYLDKKSFTGKTILVSNGQESKRIHLLANMSAIEITF